MIFLHKGVCFVVFDVSYNLAVTDPECENCQFVCQNCQSDSKKARPFPVMVLQLGAFLELGKAENVEANSTLPTQEAKAGHTFLVSVRSAVCAVRSSFASSGSMAEGKSAQRSSKRSRQARSDRRRARVAE